MRVLLILMGFLLFLKHKWRRSRLGIGVGTEGMGWEKGVGGEKGEVTVYVM